MIHTWLDNLMPITPVVRLLLIWVLSTGILGTLTGLAIGAILTQYDMTRKLFHWPSFFAVSGIIFLYVFW